MSFRKRPRSNHGALHAHANLQTDANLQTHAEQQKSLLRSRGIVAVAAVLLALPACRLEAHPGEGDRAANRSANLADVTAADVTAPANAAANTTPDDTAFNDTASDKKTANPPTAAQPAAIISEIYADDTEPPSAAPGTSAPDAAGPVGALPLLGIARGEKAPVKPCFLIVPGLCSAAKNKPIVAVTAIQTAALIADGVTTRQYLSRGYVEVDPFTRVLLGRKPTWARMAPLGTLQVFAGMWLAERMETSRHLWVRRLWWLPQVAGIVGNAAATANNVALR
jgi:hypothetical protein